VSEEEATGFRWPHAAAIVLAAETPDQRRWAKEEALKLVRVLASKHPKVVVVDLVTGGDTLGSILKVSEGHGIVDVLFRGASFSSTARRPDNENFFFLPTGTAAPPRPVLYRHPGWAKVASRLSGANAFLVPCVNADNWTESGPIAGFESCLLVNALGVEVPLPEQAKVLAEFKPPDESGVVGVMEAAERNEAPAELPVDESVEDTAPVEASAEPVDEPMADEVTLTSAEPAPEQEEPADPWARPEYAASPDPDSLYGGPFEVGSAPSLVTPEVAQATRSLGPRRLLGPVFASIAIILLAFTLWKAWQDGFFVREAALVGDLDEQVQPGDEQLEAASESAGSDAEEPGQAAREAGVTEEPPAAVSREPEETLGYSVAIASFRTVDEAAAHMRRNARSDVRFYIVPTMVRGVVWNRVLAGMLASRDEAEDLLETLVRDGVKDAANAWDIRPTWMAFRFGTYPNLQDARATVDTLEGLGIPAYLIRASGRTSGQGQAYHVYAGGYDNQATAQPLADQIARAGLEAELVERTGLPPQ
jgi:cell division septation protein DedD